MVEMLPLTCDSGPEPQDCAHQRVPLADPDATPARLPSRLATVGRRAAQPTKVNHVSLGPSGTDGPSKRTTPSAVRSSSTSNERMPTSANPAAENAARTGVTKSLEPSRLRP